MKGVITAGVVVLMLGCAPMPTLEELEAEALRTGDWTAVEERERLIAKREARRPQKCGGDLISICQKSVGRYDCQCVTKNVVTQVFTSR